MLYVAFLRAINVGGHTVTMDRLRALLEEMGLANVTTFIASGNVIFDSPLSPQELETQISSHLERSLGYAVGAFVRTGDELRGILEHPPFSEEELGGGKLYVCFLPSAPDEDAARAAAAESTDLHELRVNERELYWLGHGSIGRSDVDERALARALGMPMTMRNLNTVRRILSKLEAANRG